MGFSNGPITKPNTAYIDSLKQFVEIAKVKMEGRKVNKEYPGIKLDLNALAQDYSVDVLCDFVKSKGIENYLVEIGGEIRGKGSNDKDKYWHIWFDKPTDWNRLPGNELEAIIEINNTALATSGNCRVFYVENGAKICSYNRAQNGVSCTKYLVKHNSYLRRH